LCKKVHNKYMGNKLNNKKGANMKLTKKELDVFYHLLHSQVTSMDPVEIEDEIQDSGDIFSIKSMKDAQDLEAKILKMMKELA
jgi:DNA topoisomerase VI subunit B